MHSGGIYKLLQPLRIVSSWTVDYNIFTAFDPTPENMEFFYGSIMFSARCDAARLGIELVWSPEGDVNGYYELEFIRYVSKRDVPQGVEGIWSCRTRERGEVVRRMEEFMATRTPPSKDIDAS